MCVNEGNSHSTTMGFDASVGPRRGRQVIMVFTAIPVPTPTQPWLPICGWFLSFFTQQETTAAAQSHLCLSRLQLFCDLISEVQGADSVVGVIVVSGAAFAAPVCSQLIISQQSDIVSASNTSCFKSGNQFSPRFYQRVLVLILLEIFIW